MMTDFHSLFVFNQSINLIFFRCNCGWPRDHRLSGGEPVHRPDPAGDGERRHRQRRGSTYVEDSDMRRRWRHEDAERPGHPDYNDPEPDHWGMYICL